MAGLPQGPSAWGPLCSAATGGCPGPLPGLRSASGLRQNRSDGLPDGLLGIMLRPPAQAIHLRYIQPEPRHITRPAAFAAGELVTDIPESHGLYDHIRNAVHGQAIIAAQIENLESAGCVLHNE